jgi:NAD(P)H-quinone oxidoreductase subunit 4
MLSILLLFPLVGIIAIGLSSEQRSNLARPIALTAATLSFLWSLWLGYQFDPHVATPQFIEVLPWVESLGLSYHLSMDGLSFPLIILNGLLMVIAIYSSDLKIERSRLYYSILLFLYIGVAGAFLANNLLLFFIFYELELIPLYLLIAIWGGARRGYAATKFLIYTAVSGVLILGGFLGLTWLSGANSFDYVPLLGKSLPLAQQLILLGAIVVGFGIKIPLAPFHTWLPDAHVEASTPISVLLAGILLKLGTYGLIRFGFQLFPDAWAVAAPYLAWWAVFSVIYGSAIAIAQTDMKKMVAYSSIGHMGFILLAAAAGSPLSITGSILQMIGHGLISPLLFLLVGVVYQKTGTRDLNVLRGLLNPERGLPLIGTLMILGVMASAGMPGMVGFISEFTIFRGCFPLFPIQTLLCIIGTGLTAVYFLLLVNRAFFGRLTTHDRDRRDSALDILPMVYWRDRYPGIVLAILIVVFGLQPNWMIHWSRASINAIAPTATLVSQKS